jgi:purine-binding chemotaxis protein CheW
MGKQKTSTNKALSEATEAAPGPDDRLKILKERAAYIAIPYTVAVDKGVVLNGLSFLLSGGLYIVDANFVEEVILMPELTPLPCSPPFILGIMSSRGRILSVINLKHFLNLPDNEISDLSRVIIVKQLDIEIGLLVDEVIGHVEIDMDQLEKRLQTSALFLSEYMTGITEERGVILNLGKFLSEEKIVVNQEV